MNNVVDDSDALNCAAQQRKRLTDAWVAVPDEFVQSDDHGDDLAEVVRRMAAKIQEDQNYRTLEKARIQSIVEKRERELQYELKRAQQSLDKMNTKLSAAWREVPAAYIPDDDHDHDLAVAIARLVAALDAQRDVITRLNRIAEEEKEAVERLLRRNESRDAASADEYRRGRKELADELSAAVGEYSPGEGVWHYVMGFLDAIQEQKA